MGDGDESRKLVEKIVPKNNNGYSGFTNSWVKITIVVCDIKSVCRIKIIKK